MPSDKELKADGAARLKLADRCMARLLEQFDTVIVACVKNYDDGTTGTVVRTQGNLFTLVGLAEYASEIVKGDLYGGDDMEQDFR